MSQVTDPVLLDSTGQNIVTGISAVVSAIQSRGMPSPSASNPQMDGTASPGTSNDYARGDHVHLENPANAKTAQLAYVETGTTASRNYTAGEYICWNGLLYTVNQAIGSGATLSAGTGGNLTECPGGGFNSLSNVANANVTFSNNVTGYTYQNEYHLSKSGNVVTTSIYMSTSSIAGMGTLLCTVPEAFRPSVNRRIATWLTYNGESKVETVFISPSGEITTASGGYSISGFIRVFGMYML